jgi:glycerol-3-phosphate acyltransferase PlsY
MADEAVIGLLLMFLGLIVCALAVAYIVTKDDKKKGGSGGSGGSNVTVNADGTVKLN